MAYYKVKWAKTEMTFDSDSTLIHATEPKLGLGSRRYEFPASQVTYVYFGPGFAGNCVEITWKGSNSFIVPAPFKRDNERGMAFAHAVGRAAGLRRMSKAETDGFDAVAYTRQPAPTVNSTHVSSHTVAMSSSNGAEAPSSSSGALPPAGEGWWDDPTGRHELRYGLSDRWSDYISDNGIQGIDPLLG